MPRSGVNHGPQATGSAWLLLTFLILAALLALPHVGSAQAIKLIDYTTTSWKYHTNNIDPGYVPADAWVAPGFDDSTWPSGFGIFGRESTPAVYTDPSATYISCQCPFNTFIPQPPAVSSSYFRTHFNWAGNPAQVSFRFTNYVDDSVVVYLNGAILYTFNFRDTTVFPYAWNGFDPSGTANPLGEGVPIVTNVLAAGLVSGDNVLAVQLVQQGGTSSDDVFTLNLWATPPIPLAISQQPTNITSTENRVLNLAVGVTGTAPQFQWYKGTNPAVAIPDATNATYTIANTAVSDTGNYFVIATNYLNAVTSQVARVTISNDTNGPVLLSVKTDESFQKIILTWDETISSGPVVELSNYVIEDSSLNVINVSSVEYLGNVVILHVPTLAIGADYTIEVDYQQDLVGNLTPPVGGPIYDPNGVATNFHTWVISPGFTRFQAYLSLPAGQSISQFAAMPIYPNGQTFGFFTNVLYWPQSLPGNGYEQYAMRFSGLFVAPETGLYKFGPDHDDDARLRISDSELPSGTISEMAPACCTGLLDGPTLDVSLVAGQRYYYELIVREFGGGDHAGISVILPSGPTNSPISQEYLAIAFDPANTAKAGISQQPQTQTILDNHAATFSVTVTNAANGVAYQWQLSSGGGFNNIAGAIGSSLTTPLRTLANEGDQYRVIAYTPGLIITSAVAVLHVNNDTVPPQALAVHGTASLNAIRVTFNEALASGSATTVGNYTLTSNGVPVSLSSPTLGADLVTVTIQTAPQTPGTFYVLHVQNVTDAAGNPVVSTNITFQAWIYSQGLVLKELYLGLNAGTVVISDLRASPNYPNSPSLVRYGDTPELNTFDEFEGYGARMSGYLIPPTSGNYTFYMSSDDNGEFWLSTDSSAANIALIAKEPVYAGRRVWTGESAGGGRVSTPSPSGGPQANISGPISLVAGQQYYFEALVKEGGGGDNLAFSWQVPGGPVPVNGALPSGGLAFATLADPVGASITITQQPASQTFIVAAGASTVLNESFNASGGTFTVSTPQAMDGPWTYSAGSGSWIYDGQGPDNAHPNTSILISPTLAVTAVGNVLLSFAHRYSFEFDGTAWDGGQVQISKNGGGFVAVPLSSFLQNGYNGSVSGGSSSQLAGQPSFISTSLGHGSNTKLTSICNLGLFAPGDTIVVRFFAASDTNTKGATPNWELDSFVLSQGNPPAANVTFTVGADAVNANGPNPPRFYQWFRNNGGGFVPISGANGPSYTILPVLADNGAIFRVVISIPGASATSSSAVLTVNSGTPALALRSSYAGGTLNFSWDAPARLQYTTSLTPPIVWVDINTGGATTYSVNPTNEFNVSLDAFQEANPIGLRTGTGRGTVTLSNNVLKVNATYTGLSAPRSNIHFHAPAPRGSPAGVAYDIGGITTGTTSGTILGDVPLAAGAYGGKSIAAQIQDLRNGLWYINIHSTAFTGGEIRGQVEPGARFYRLISP